MVIEDLHWIDGGSEEVLGNIVDGEATLRLLLVHTRRPEYQPTWLDRPTATKLRLEPLPSGDIRRLAQSRLVLKLPKHSLCKSPRKLTVIRSLPKRSQISSANEVFCETMRENWSSTRVR